MKPSDCPACGGRKPKGAWLCRRCFKRVPQALLDAAVSAVKESFTRVTCAYSGSCPAAPAPGRRMCPDHLEGARMAQSKYRASLDRFCQLCHRSSDEKTINHRACLDALKLRRRAATRS